MAHRPGHPALSLVFAPLLALAPSVAAQPSPLVSLPSAESLLPAPYVDPERSLRLLETLRSIHPERTGLHLAAAREATTLGILDERPEGRIRWLEKAVDAARAGLALDSLDAEARYWLAASLGLLADQEGGRTKISLAREAYEVALRTLDLDPEHGGAHHIVGRLHAGARRLSWVSRLVARGLGLGEIIDEASWESAEAHMRTAVREAPGPLVHTYELGRLLVETGVAPAEGRALLRTLARRSPRHDLDAHYIALAARSIESPEPGGG